MNNYQSSKNEDSLILLSGDILIDSQPNRASQLIEKSKTKEALSPTTNKSTIFTKSLVINDLQHKRNQEVNDARDFYEGLISESKQKIILKPLKKYSTLDYHQAMHHRPSPAPGYYRWEDSIEKIG